MVDTVYRSRSLGTSLEGIPDQYADGRAAKLWEIYIGDKKSRTDHYKNFLLNLLHKNKSKKLLDLATGTGIDSVMLVEESFEVISVDASDKMLKYALKTRWSRRKEPAFDNWVIEEANWLTLVEDLKAHGYEDESFDVLMCLGNSFAHLPDFSGDQRDHRLAFQNFAKLIKPGGILIIDHRNYDYILESGKTPGKNIYYNSQHIADIRTSVLHQDGKAKLITLDYVIDVPEFADLSQNEMNRFRLSYYPWRLSNFTKLLKESFGQEAKHEIFGDFDPITNNKEERINETAEPPAFYIHVITKPKM